MLTNEKPIKMSQFTFPDDNIDPKKKGRNWILQYAKAAYYASRTNLSGRMYFGQDTMNENIAYANGMPPISKYKKQYLGSDQNDVSWENIDFSPVNYLSKFINIVVEKTCQRGYDVQCTAVDALSKSEEDEKYNKIKAKILMRQVAQQAGSELANAPELMPDVGEPEDIEALEMQKEFNFKHVLAMEAELGIQMVQQQNGFEEIREGYIRDIVNQGIGGLFNEIDENGAIITENVDPRNLIISYCNNRDFSDATYIGRIKEVFLGDIAPYFSKSQMIEIGEKVKGQMGNPLSFNYSLDNWYHGVKAYVLDIRIKTWNTYGYEERVDKSQNIRFGKTEYKNAVAYQEGDDDNETIGAKPIYYSNVRETIYKGKWIIDTECIYDYGLSENMVRKPSSWTKTSLDFQLRAINFDRMKYQGLTRMLIPLQDQINLVWYKMQNLSAKLIPYIISLDMSAFENVAYGKAGEPNNPQNITEFLFSNFTAIYRSKNLLNPNSNQAMRPVTIEPTGQLAIFGEYRNQILMFVEQMKSICGLNDITDGSTPNERNLTSTNEAGTIGTNNALGHIFKADKYIVQDNADNIVQKIQIAVKLGKVEGVVKALGKDTLNFLQINPDISLREFGIIAKDLPTDEQRQMLWQDVSMKESQGLLDVTDKELIMSCTNMKQAMMQVADRINKRKEEVQRMELQKIQEANKGQQQMIAMQAQSEQSTIGVQLQADLARMKAEFEYTYQIEAMKKQADFDSASVQAQSRNIGDSIQAEAKKVAAEIAANASVFKQHVANEKPKTKAPAK